MSSSLVSKGIEELSQIQRGCVEEYLSICQADGVVTGVMVGSESWDLRPLVLENGKLEIIRFLSPDRSRDYDVLSGAVRALEKAFSRFPAQFEPVGIYQSASRIWSRRLFPPQTLVEAIDPFVAHSLEIKSSAVQLFLEALRQLYHAGLSHGNLTLSNVGFANGLLIPLDCGLHSLPGGRSDGNAVAAELKNIEAIFSVLKFSGLSPSHVAELMSIGSREGTPLAILNEVLEKFEVSEPPVPEPAERVTGDDSLQPAAAPRGRIIEAKVAGRGVTQKNLTETPAPPEKTPGKGSLTLKLPSLDVARHRENLKQVSTRFDRRTLILVVGMLLGFLGLAITVTRGFGLFTPRSRVAEYQRLWSSDQADQQGVVLDQALIDPFSEAIEVIRKDVLSGKRHPNVRSEIVKVAFDPQWFAALNAQDRRTVLSIAMGDLVPADRRQIGSFSQLHPGVLLALAGMVSLDHPGDMFSGIDLDRFVKLPAAVGAAFKLFVDGGIKELRHPAPRAYAHLYMGDGAREAFERYLIGNTDIEFTRSQLRIIQPLLVRNPGYAKPLADLLTNSGLALATQFDWFDADQTANWAATSPLVKLSLLSGFFPPSDLSLEQYIDLLQFPLAEIREGAQSALTKRYVSENYRSLLIVLSSAENKLSRGQLIFLVSALQLPDDEAFAFFSRWFSGEPDPDTVFLILLSRSRTRKAAPFDIEAARYLIDRQWSSSTDELGELVMHPEPLARALAYSRLDPKKPADLKILQGQLEKEASDRLRKQVQEKLTGFR